MPGKQSPYFLQEIFEDLYLHFRNSDNSVETCKVRAGWVVALKSGYKYDICAVHNFEDVQAPLFFSKDAYVSPGEYRFYDITGSLSTPSGRLFSLYTGFELGNFYETLKWENYLNAMEDYEYLWLVNRSIQYLRVNSTNFTSSDLDQFEVQLHDILTSVVGYREEYCQHPSTLYNARLNLAAMLDDFSAYMDIVSIAEEKWCPPQVII